MFSKTIEIFNRAFDDKLFSAGALAFGVGDEIIYKGVLGNVSFSEGADKVTEKSLFDIASMTKIYSTTLLALKFIDSGRLSLDDKLDKFFETVPADKQSITIQNLMTHSAGYVGGIPLYKLCQTPDEAANLILNSPLQYAPGTETVYSCMGFILLGKIIEKIAGKNLHELSKELIFEPFGMKSTGYRPVDNTIPDNKIVHTENMTKSGICEPGRVHDENARFLNGISGNAGVFSSLTDSIILMQRLAGKNIGISETLFDLATKDLTPGLSQSRGLGFQIGGPNICFMQKWGERAFGHTGFTGTSFLVDKESGFYLVMLTNRVHPTRETPKFFDFRDMFYNILYDDALTFVF